MFEKHTNVYIEQLGLHFYYQCVYNIKPDK